MRPLIARAAGRSDTTLQLLPARLAAPVGKSCPLRRYLRARVAWGGGELLADPALSQQSTVLSSLVHAHGYVELPPGACPDAGAPVRFWLRPELAGALWAERSQVAVPVADRY